MKHFLHSLKALPLLCLIFVLLGGCSLRVGETPLLPIIFLIPAYYWLVFRPDCLPLWSLFGIGIVYDALLGLELCFSSLLLILSALLAGQIRPFLNPQSFFLLWGSFCFYSLGYLFLYGFLAPGSKYLLFSWIYGVVLYPPSVWLLSHIHSRLQSYV